MSSTTTSTPATSGFKSLDALPAMRGTPCFYWPSLPGSCSRRCSTPLGGAAPCRHSLLWRGRLALCGAALPSRWVLAGALAVAIGATWASHKTIVGRDAGVTGGHAAGPQDTGTTRPARCHGGVFLGFFVLLSNFFYSQSLPTAAAMVLGLMGLLTALVNAHMTAGKPPLRQALRTAAKLALWGAPVMVALFLFPTHGAAVGRACRRYGGAIRPVRKHARGRSRLTGHGR
ncbi:DUF3488 domain-containing protein [Staphylococcus epidermidis]|nr:DUF3488 domain-containing protein [Staphylococcus epidermidis]